MKRYKPIYKLWVNVPKGMLNEITLSDLNRNQGISDFTKVFKKERNKIMGSETKNSKFIEVKFNKDEDYIDCYWLITPTEKKYPPNYKYKEVDPYTHKLIDNPSKTYTFILRIMNFFSLLATTPNKITNKDIEDVIRIADLKIWDSNPSFQYQQMNWHLSDLDSSIFPTTIPPKRWNKIHGEPTFLGKHSQSIINQINFFIPMIRMSIKKKLGLTKK